MLVSLSLQSIHSEIVQVMKQIEEVRIEMMYCASAMIAKKVIERGKRLRQIRIATPVDNVEPFAGVRVVEAKSIFLDYFRGI